MEEILEPCPFCGSEKVRIVRGPMFGTTIVRCHGCGMAAYMQGPGDLLDGWNRRAGGAASTSSPTRPRSTGSSAPRTPSSDGGRRDE